MGLLGVDTLLFEADTKLSLMYLAGTFTSRFLDCSPLQALVLEEKKSDQSRASVASTRQNDHDQEIQGVR